MAARRWTDAQRRDAAVRAVANRPWRHATGPRSPAGKAVSRLNGLTHGGRSAAARDLSSLLARARRFRVAALRRMAADDDARRFGFNTFASFVKTMDMVADLDTPVPPPVPTRCGFVAVLGSPNAGKSTLVNALVGEKVTIVSDKVQTTRMPVRGIRIHDTHKDRAQIVFVDTPGIFTPGKRFERAMVASAWGAGDEADLVMLVIDASRKTIPDRETSMIIDRIKQGRAPAILAFNKVDAIRPEALLPLTVKLNALHDFRATFMISALKERGTDDILKWLAANLPEGPFLYPDDEVTDLPLRLMAAELTREKLFQRLYRELPHALTVETETWEEFDDGSVRIAQVIFVEREGQRKIILGSGGEMIREVGQDSRADLAAIIGRPVHLKLFVKVREGWAEDAERYAPWSLEFNA